MWIKVKRKKAKPILLTPIAMRIFDEHGKARNGLSVYPEIVRKVAAAYDVPLIDLNQQTSDYISELGEEASESLYMCLQAADHSKYPRG